MDIEKLIECVRRHLFLYDLTHKDYKNVTLKAIVWDSIARELNQNGETVKKRWKSLRDGYNKYKKCVKGTTGSSRRNIFYVWSSQLSFLDNYNIIQPTVSNIVSKTTQSYPHFETYSEDSDPPRDFVPPPSNLSSGSSTPPSAPPPLLPPPPPLLLSPASQIITRELTQNLPSASNTPAESSRNTQSIRSNKRYEIDDVGRVIDFLGKKRKKVHDGIDHLFLSYADTFKKFPLHEQAMLKLELAKLFTNTEIRLIHNTRDPQFQRASHSSPAHSNVSSNNNILFEEINTQTHQAINLSHNNNNPSILPSIHPSEWYGTGYRSDQSTDPEGTIPEEQNNSDLLGFLNNYE